MSQSSNFEFLFDHVFNAKAQAEAADRGYLPRVKVRMPDGKQHTVTFYDHVRLSQDIAEELFIAEPGLIVLSDVTLDLMRRSVAELIESGYFDHFRPL